MKSLSSINLTLSREPRNVAAGRHALRPLEPLLGDRAGEVRLLVSELLTNAVRHGCGDHMRLKVAVTGSTVRVEVVDGGEGFRPPAVERDPASPGGRGLRLVEALADDWGVYDGSTHVWFDMKLS